MSPTAKNILAELAEAFSSLPKESRKLLAVSGGIDSMLLLEAAYRLKAENIVVLHVNHGLRGAESDADEALVRRVAGARNFPFFSTKLNWAEEKPSQAACRKRREEFFSGLLGAGEKIFLAHHQDDQAETLFLRLLRGTGLDGLGGMALVSGTKVRPLLSFSRSEIEAAAKFWKVEWREDSSNASSKYERNWLRNEILPLLEARRPGFSRRLADLAAEVRCIPASATRPAELFSLNEAIRFGSRDSLLALGARGLKNAFGLDRKHSESLLRLLEKGSGECLAPKTRFSLSQGILLVESGKKFSDELVWKDDGEMQSAESVLGKWLYRGVKLGKRKELAAGVKGKKKFQEAGVPLFFRDSLPVLAKEGGKILFPLSPSANLSFEPSALGAWWINSSTQFINKPR